jgi:hypothetical protein
MAKKVKLKIKLSQYTKLVLQGVKERYNLNSYSAAVDKFAELYGKNYLPKVVKEEKVVNTTFAKK